jgi:hypothetical protein
VSLLVPLLLLLLSIPLVLALVRANELFALDYRSGKLRVRRGRIPHGLLTDIGDILRNAGVDEADVRGVVVDGRAKVYIQGQVPRPVRQRLMNSASLWPVAKIRNAPRRR